MATDKEYSIIWVQYEQIKLRGSIYFIRGNERIQVTSPDFIHFYVVCKNSLEPKLENVMYNYTECNTMMIGPAKRFAVTYQNGSNYFDLFTRKYMHNFRVQIDPKNLEG